MERYREAEKRAGEEEGIQKKRGTAQWISVCCSMAGTVLLILLVSSCLPLTVPRLFGLRIYSVVSGSMEPAIPTGSLVYIREIDPEDVKAGEVVAFYGTQDDAAVITHRVVENRLMMGELITKGDANPADDRTPVDYERLIGRVVRFIPGAGRAAELLTSSFGKALAGGTIAAAVILQVLSGAVKAGKDNDRR